MEEDGAILTGNLVRKAEEVMTAYLQGVPKLLTRLMLALCLALLAAALLLGVPQSKETQRAFGLALVGAAAVWLVLPRLSGLLAGLGAVRVWVLLTLLCLLIKGAWVVLVRIPPEGDYATFWGYANSLAQSPVIGGSRYMALFPHIFGYASFLSWFIRLLGPGELLAQGLNVALTALSGSMMFLLAKRWWGLAGGVSAYLIWIACPSQTMYNALILSEPLYTALLLAILVLLALAEEERQRRAILLGAGAGVLLRLMQGSRPIAPVVIIALLLWRFLLKPEVLARQTGRRFWLPLLAVLLVVYGATGPLWNAHLANRMGEEPATTPGYSVLVGFNQASGGRWNQGDSEQLFSYSDQPGATAQQAQKQAMAAAVDRITSGEVRFLSLMKAKIKVFLGSDDTCVDYSRSVLRHTTLFSLVCNGFYYAFLLLAGAGIIRLWRTGTRSAALLLPLYVLGLTCAQMLVEVAGRYHYSILPALFLLGTGALFPPAPAAAEKIQKIP